jgi:hypothetical protein
VERAVNLTQLAGVWSRLAWREDPRRPPCLPDLIILPDGELQDFLAWTSTYLGDYRPLTAQLRVLEVSAADRYFGAKYARPEGWLEAVFAGLIICETLTYFDIERDPNAIPGVAFFSSYSFSRARHAVLWNGEGRSSGLLDDWTNARRFGGQEVPSDITAIRNPFGNWSTGFLLSRTSSNRVCRRMC